VHVVPDLKWPNDLLVGGRKLAGILAESSHGAVVVGIGLNVGWAPDGATSLAAEVASERPQPMEVLEAMFPVIDRLMACDDVELAVEYRAALATIGTEVRVDRVGLEPLVGRAVDVRDDGLLVIATVHGEVKVSAGDVVHLRPT
jgi:BirA family biotin operon repressor/biotin-[acetyl-CoA-carboxylase] ligase